MLAPDQRSPSPRCRRDRDRLSGLPQGRRDRQPVPERDAEIFEMLLGQVGQNKNMVAVMQQIAKWLKGSRDARVR